MEAKSKTPKLMADQEAKLVESINRLPWWARPIALKYLGKYRQAINKVRILEPETFNECLIESRHIVEEMVEEIKQEAIRHGYPLAVIKGAGISPEGASLSANTRKKQLKN